MVTAMKKRVVFIIFLAMLGVISFSQVAMADYDGHVSVNNGGYGLGPYTSGQGGEFTLNITGGLDNVLNNYSTNTKNVNENDTSTFQTFCLETNEYIYKGLTYDTTIQTSAVGGGSGPQPLNPDPISQGTAWLYHQFTDGTLKGLEGTTEKPYNYSESGSGRSTSAGLLQNTIWWLEGELWYKNGSGVYENKQPENNIFTTAVKNQFIDPTENATTAQFEEYGVKALNLTRIVDGQKVPYQSMLVRTSSGTSNVPLPPAVWLLGTGLIGLFGVRRRFTR
jgi:hypothetical protein